SISRPRTADPRSDRHMQGSRRSMIRTMARERNGSLVAHRPAVSINRPCSRQRAARRATLGGVGLPARWGDGGPRGGACDPLGWRPHPRRSGARLTTPALIAGWLWPESPIRVASDFAVGSPITWSGVWHRVPYTDKGIIVRSEPERALAYTRWSRFD